MKIDITSDVYLEGPVWADALDHLVPNMFNYYWDLYALCITIGMMYDEQVSSNSLKPDGYDISPRSIPRNVLTNSTRMDLIQLMVESALVTTKHLDLSEDDRLELAFQEDPNIDIDFNPMKFLTEFANAGILRLSPLISNVDQTETMESMMEYLDEIYEEGVEVIDDPIELDND